MEAFQRSAVLRFVSSLESIRWTSEANNMHSGTYLFMHLWLLIASVFNDQNGALTLIAVQNTQPKDVCCPRPRNVPLKAVWVGSSDGGVYILLSRRQSHGERYCAKIFSDSTGKILFSGLVVRSPEMSKPIHTTASMPFDGWDGREILLTDGTTLKPLGTKCRL